MSVSKLKTTVLIYIEKHPLNYSPLKEIRVSNKQASKVLEKKRAKNKQQTHVA